jgi:2-polyprenyl-3-methyl-5-hydroxy-6-metoxy-1,4-benzoquinol methylase
MSLGPLVRSLFGRHERAIADAYRTLFVDLDHLVELLTPDRRPAAILDLGCGEGAGTTRLARKFPDAEILGIDLTPRVGRLFDGDRTRVSFQQTSIQELAMVRPASFDLILAADVIHHIPIEERVSVLAAARQTMRPGGTFVLKDWTRSNSPIHALCWASDRFLTGDAVRYCDVAELRALFLEGLRDVDIINESTVPPWSNNKVLIGTIS